MYSYECIDANGFLSRIIGRDSEINQSWNNLWMGVMGLGPVRVCPEGTGELSESGRSIRFIIPGYRGVFVTLARQVRGMMDQWPARRAAVFWEEG